MTKYHTNNPLGSTDPRDLYDNAQNFDAAVNDLANDTWKDRFGRERKTLKGYDSDFQQFLIDSGYVNIGDYAAGLEITARNQIFWRDGELYRAGASLELPYTTTGDWGDEEGLFVAVGDQALRQQLENAIDALFGAGQVAFGQDVDYPSGSVGAAITRRVSSINALRALRGRLSDDVVYLVGYYEDAPGMGAGMFRWEESSSEADNGGTVVSAGGAGRWVRVLANPFVTLHEFGGRPNVGPYSEANFDIKDNIESAVATGLDVYINPGRYLYSGDGVALNRAQRVFGNRSGRNGGLPDTTAQLESTKANTPFFTFDYRLSPGTGIYGVSGPSVEGLRILSDFPIKFGDPLSDINSDTHVAPIMLGRIAGNYLQSITSLEGTGIELTKGFDYQIVQNEIAEFNRGIRLIGSDINTIEDNRVMRCRTAHVEVFSTGTFGSQNRIVGNDLLRAESTNCVYIRSNDRHTRIYDNYLEETGGPMFGFIDISPSAVPESIGPNQRSTICSIVCENNRIDGQHHATQFIHRVDPTWATMISLKDSNTTGPTPTINVPFNIVGGGLKSRVASGGAPTHYSIDGAAFGMWDGYRTGRMQITPKGFFLDNTVVQSIALGAFQNNDVLVTPFGFDLPAGLPDGSRMYLYPQGRSGRNSRPYLVPGRTYTITANISTTSSGGAPVLIGWGADGVSNETTSKNVGQFQDQITMTFTAPAGAVSDFYLIVQKGTGSEGARVRLHSISVES